MEHLVDSYNKALEFLQRERYEAATELLEEIRAELPNHPQVNWTLGLVHVMEGYPHQGLELWSGITEEDIPQIFASKQRIEQKLPFYERLYETYNQALGLVKDNHMKETNSRLKELLSHQKEVPLPVDFYQAYVLSTILIGEENRVLTELKGFPNYVKNARAIQKIEQSLNFVPLAKAKQRWSMYGLGLIASMFIGAFAIQFFDGSKEISVAEPVTLSQEITSETANYKAQVVELEETVNELRLQQEQLKLDMEKAELELGEQFMVQELLSAANVDLEVLAKDAGLSTYRKGLETFKSGQYEEAVSFFEQSRTYQSDNYFSDDAFYFFIQSKKRLNETEHLVDLYNQFLEENQLSPYFDDVLLEKAELLLVSGNTDEAIPLLKKIQQEFPNEWTAGRSLNLLKEFTEANDANN